MHRSSGRPTQGRRRRAFLALPCLLAASVGLTACHSAGAASPSSSPGGGAPVYGSTTPTPSKAAPASGAALAVRSTSLGTILTDGRGFTVYAFDADKGTKSACTGACASAWPPVTTTGSTPKVASGVTQSLLGQSTRGDGTRQLTYAGRPLYLFQGDGSPGDTNGDGSEAFGARWDALTAAGKNASGGS